MKEYLLVGKKKTVIEVDYNALDCSITTFLKEKNYKNKNFIKNGYECIAENEWGNYQEHSFNVSNNLLPFEVDDIEDLSTNEILDWMCYENRIEPGEYLVNVFW